jgi:iron-sulfur cluster repair protein YtfE (RIC family)
MDAITLLRKDHHTIRSLFEDLKPLTGRAEKTRQELFDKLRYELDVHQHVEEKIFYPVVRKEALTHDIALEGKEEHHVIDLLLHELSAMDIATERWGVKLHVLSENVEHHLGEEEEKMFPDAREILEKSKIVDLGDKIEAEKKVFKATWKSA